MTPAEARKVATEFGWLSRQPEDFARRLLDAARLRRTPAGQPLITLDDPPGGLTCVVAGYVDVVIAPGPFAPMLGALGGPGWWFGEVAFLTGTRRRVDLRARAEVWTLTVPERSLEQIVAEEPQAIRRLSMITVSHLDDALSFVACLNAADGLLKVAVTLLRIAGPSAEKLASVEVPIRQDELGEIVRLSRNRIGRILAEMERIGAASRGYRRIAIRPERLRAIVQGGARG